MPASAKASKAVDLRKGKHACPIKSESNARYFVIKRIRRSTGIEYKEGTKRSRNKRALLGKSERSRVFKERRGKQLKSNLERSTINPRIIMRFIEKPLKIMNDRAKRAEMS